MPKKLKQTYFEDKWLDDPRFTKWIEKVPENAIFGCKFCKKKNIKLSNMGIQAVISHKGTQAHEKEEKKNVEIERFFKKHVKCTKTVNETNKENAEVLSPQSPQSSNDSTIDLTEKSSPKSKAESTSTTYQQTAIDHGISASDVVKAEIIWTSSVARGFSNNLAKDLHSTFETMFSGQCNRI